MLAQKQIVITRPQAQAEDLAHLIRQQGGNPLVYPVLEIRAIDHSPEQTELLTQLYQDQFDYAVFVSPNAVTYAATYLTQNLPKKLICIAIGAGTAKALRETSPFCFQTVYVPMARFDSEGVLALEALQAAQIQAKQVIIFRGQEGRTLLGQTLQARGAHVTYFTCYERICLMQDDQFLLKKQAAHALDALIFTSSEGLRAFETRLSPQGHSCLKTIPLFIPHPRIVSLAQEYGYHTVIQTPPLDEGILAGLMNYFAG